MGDALADIFLGSVDLGADLACFKVAHTPRLCGGAEPAAHAAAHLCGYAHGIAVVVTHDNGLDAVAVSHAQQILHSTVFSLLTALDLRCSDIKAFFQLCQQGFGLVGHGSPAAPELSVQQSILPASGKKYSVFVPFCSPIRGYDPQRSCLLRCGGFLQHAQEKAVHAGAGGHRKATMLPCRHSGGQWHLRCADRKFRVAL